jgi:hypothetical protein
MSAAYWVLFCLVLAVAVIGTFVRLTEDEQTRLAEQYHVTKNRVYITPKPHDCEFEAVPYGKKYCHYEKHIDYSPGGYPTTTLPDGRKAIGWSDLQKDPKPPEVVVRWERVEEQ